MSGLAEGERGSGERGMSGLANPELVKGERAKAGLAIPEGERAKGERIKGAMAKALSSPCSTLCRPAIAALGRYTC